MNGIRTYEVENIVIIVMLPTAEDPITNVHMYKIPYN